MEFFGEFGHGRIPSEAFFKNRFGEGWARKRFVPVDMVVFRDSDGKVLSMRYPEPTDDPNTLEIIPRGWDFEECEICGNSIMESDDPNVNTGYVSGYEWLCIKCHFALFGTDEDQVEPDQTQG